jgi:putative phosphoribosyl transferase
MIDVERTFADRKEAGIALGNLLKSEYQDLNALVIAIPRGGVEVAYEVAKILRAELSVVITKKLPHPRHPELAIGAAAEDGSVYLTSHARNLTESTIRQIVNTQLKEIQSRILRFRDGRPLPVIENRTVILADDGIATGATLVPALNLCRRKKASKIIVAAPVSGKRMAEEITALADEIKIIIQPERFYSVSQVYEDFHGLSDDEVTDLLKNFEQHRLSYG